MGKENFFDTAYYFASTLKKMNILRARTILKLSLFLFLSACSLGPSDVQAKPNFILIFVDDLGYGDLGVYGSKLHRTPEIDKMSREGVRFTDFYSTSGVCTPSRGSLLTGSYPRRLNLHIDSNDKWVLFPNGHKGLHPNEVTIAEILKSQGYATACIGKWHLGDQPEFLPTRQGFDSYYGIPYSNDMDRKGIPLPLMRNENVIEAPVDQILLTQNYTSEAIQFIQENKDRPFFLYLPHTMPHIPLFSSEGFRGKSANGDYGDAVEELDWSTGQILKTLKELEIDNNTLVIFTSDNGADPRYGGSNAPFSGWKGDTDEGSMRIPFIARWPGMIPANHITRELATTLDILPTFCHLSDSDLPKEVTIDGHNIWPLLSGKKGAESAYKAFYYYHTSQLQAVRSGDWKLVLPQKVKKIGWAKEEKNTPLKLYNLSDDLAEKNDVSKEYPEIVKKLIELSEKARTDLGDVGKDGAGQRKAGWVENPEPQLISSSDSQ